MRLAELAVERACIVESGVVPRSTEAAISDRLAIAAIAARYQGDRFAMSPSDCAAHRGSVLRRAGGVFALLIAAVGLVQSATAADEALPKGTLSGRVVDEAGQRVAGARVWLNTYGNKLLVEGVSDAEGRFELGPVEPVYRHHFDVFIDAEGFARQYVLDRTYSIFPGADSDLGTIRMDRGSVFTGQVLDHDGTPVASALIDCDVYRHYFGNTIMSVGPVRQVRTDPDGRYRTPRLGIGERIIVVRTAHRRMAWTEAPDAPVGEHTLAPMTLEPDVPIVGTIVDEHGRPVVGAAVSASDVDTTKSNSEGKFVLSGFESNPRFQLQIHKEGRVFINWGVTGTDDGFRWHEVGGDGKEYGPLKELAVVMPQTARIQGIATDAETGKPVQLDQVVLCFFERKANGEIVLGGCRATDFDQPEPGHFRVAYSATGEFHLTFSAKGYHDAEAFTPKVATLTPIDGINVKMRKRVEGSSPSVARQTISGEVTEQAPSIGTRAVKTGWVGLWTVRHPENLVNAYVMRGRTIAPIQIIYDRSPIRDGKYSLTVPFQGEGFYVVAELPGRAPTQLGPLAVALGEEKPLDIACVEGGAISGIVKHPPKGWENDLWVVAFTDTGIQSETRVSSDGTFSLDRLPPGRYGLKVGHDAYRDSEIPHHPGIPPEAWKATSEPWKRAVVVEVKAGEESDGVELELPRD